MQLWDAQNTLKQRAQAALSTEDAGDWKQFYKHPKCKFTHKLTMNILHNSVKSKFWAIKCCIANAKWMAFPNFKVAIFYVVK